MYRNNKRFVASLLGACAITASIAACSSSSSDSGHSGSTESSDSGSKAKLSLTVADPSNTIIMAHAFWALRKGLFDDVGLKVSITEAGGVGATEVAAGKFVVGNFGGSSIIGPTSQGRKMSIVYETSAGPNAAFLFVKGDSKYKSLQDLSGTRIGVVAAGGNTYGAAEIYSKYIVDHGGKALTIVPLGTGGSIVSALAAGTIQSAAEVVDPFMNGIKAGKVRILVNPSTGSTASLFQSDVVNSAVYGTNDALDKNSEAITRFVAGMRLADYQIASATTADLTSVAQTIPGVKDEATADQLTELFTYDAPFFPTSDGFITEDAWAHSLQTWTTYGLKVDLTKSTFSYQNLVDMSYWNKASSIIKTFCDGEHDASLDGACANFENSPNTSK